MSWLATAIEQITTNGEGQTEVTEGITTDTTVHGARTSTLSSPSKTGSSTHTALARTDTQTLASPIKTQTATLAAPDKTNTETTTEDAGVMIRFKLKIRGGLDAGGAVAPLCP